MLTLYENQAQMELEGNLSEAASASHYMLSSTFTGYITFIEAIWALSFSCCLIHLAKISNEALMHRIFKTLSILAIYSTANNLLLRSSNTKSLVYTDRVFEWRKRCTIQTSIIYLPLHCEKAEICLLQAVRGASIWMEEGWSYEVSLRAWWSNLIMKFYWQALFNAYHWLNIF